MLGGARIVVLPPIVTAMRPAIATDIATAAFRGAAHLVSSGLVEQVRSCNLFTLTTVVSSVQVVAVMKGVPNGV